MNEELIKKWFVVRIKTNSYELAIRNLKRQGFKTFFPKMQITKKKQNKFINKDVPVFPGYIFISINTQSVNWTKINNTYGVSNILVFNKKPYEISSELIMAFKIRYEANIDLTSKQSLHKGDIIRFNSGPFVDLLAKIENIDKKNRIWVLLEGIGEYRKLKLQQTEKIEYVKV